MILRNASLFIAFLIAAVAGHSSVPAEEIQESIATVAVVERPSSNRGVARLSISSTAKRKLEKELKKKYKNKSKMKKAMKQLPKSVQRAIVRNRTRVHNGKINANQKLGTQISRPTMKAKPDQTQK